MRMPLSRSSMTLLFVFIAGLVPALACGSTPKNEPGTATATPSATPPSSASAMPASTGDSGATATAGDAGGGQKKDKAAECDELSQDANSTMDAEIIAVDKPCKADKDCMTVKGRACKFICVTNAIPKIEEKDWTDALKKVQDGSCKKWTELECEKLNTKGPPTCQKDKWIPKCNKGHCELKEK
jgi:hypothetical protein